MFRVKLHAMTTFAKATTPELDSVEYKLMNVFELSHNSGSDNFIIDYSRASAMQRGLITFAELECIRNGLSDIFLSFYKNVASASHLIELRAFVSYLFNAHTDFGIEASSQYALPLLASVNEVRSSTEGFINITGIFFVADKPYDNGVPKIKKASVCNMDFPVRVVDDAWPDCSKNLKIMEELGYSQTEIVKAISYGFNNDVVYSSLFIPTFE